MKKFLAAMVLVVFSLFLMPAVNAAVQTFEGVGEYYMSELEKVGVARQRAKQKAVQDAQRKAGVYLKSYSRSINSEITDNEILAITSNAYKIIDETYEIRLVPLSDGTKTVLVTAKVKATIDTDEINKWLERNATERKEIIAQNKDLQKEIAERDRELAELKKKLAEHEQRAKENVKKDTPVSTQQVGGQIFEGVGEYRLGSSETIINAEKGARILAMQNALERAGILVSSYSQVKDFELDKDVITTKSHAVLKVLEAKPDWKDFVCRMTVKVDINVAELNKWLEQEAKKSN